MSHLPPAASSAITSTYPAAHSVLVAIRATNARHIPFLSPSHPLDDARERRYDRPPVKHVVRFGSFEVDSGDPLSFAATACGFAFSRSRSWCSLPSSNDPESSSRGRSCERRCGLMTYSSIRSRAEQGGEQAPRGARRRRRPSPVRRDARGSRLPLHRVGVSRRRIRSQQADPGAAAVSVADGFTSGGHAP